jgi:hypothetical protein
VFFPRAKPGGKVNKEIKNSGKVNKEIKNR